MKRMGNKKMYEGEGEEETRTVENEDLEKTLEQARTIIKVIGCGGSGTNTIQRMIEEGIFGAEFFALNTDAQHLLFSKVDRKLLIGKRVTRGLGAGSIPRLGEEAARENETDIKGIVEDADMVFVTCGLGGGTGTGAAPVVAQAAQEAGALTIGVVTIPFSAEGAVRMENMAYGLEKLRENTDTLIVIPNDKLLDVVPRLPLNEAFRFADEVLMRSVKGLTELITKPGLINLDFADVRTVMKDGGMAMIGFGEAEGENKAVESVRKAVSSPLLEVDVTDAKAALVNVIGGEDMTVEEAEGALQEVYKMINPEARIIWGVQISPELKSMIRTLLIVTGVKSEQIYARKVVKKEKFGIEIVQ
ncbi:MAG: cell division protein FtsZ [Methanophagales archaeon ANME-1-THS]|nr:MAG: cell division protein FtsZ [Methanophagales archaeon ANME-1-THS]